MATRKTSHANADLLMTVTMLFLDKNNGTYRTHAGLRARIEAFLDNEYRHDLAWLDREKNTDALVDLVVKSGGVVVAEMPSLDGREKRVIAERGDK